MRGQILSEWVFPWKNILKGKATKSQNSSKVIRTTKWNQSLRVQRTGDVTVVSSWIQMRKLRSLEIK